MFKSTIHLYVIIVDTNTHSYIYLYVHTYILNTSFNSLIVNTLEFKIHEIKNKLYVLPQKSNNNNNDDDDDDNLK
jgi:hypothetical protein